MLQSRSERHGVALGGGWKMQDDKTGRRVQVILTQSSSCCVSLLCAPSLGGWLRKEGIAWESHEPTSNSFCIAIPALNFCI